MDREAWWAAVCSLTQSRTRLKQLSMHACIGEGHGNPLQYSCLENPRDKGAWWAAIYGFTQSQTRLKQLSSSSSISLRDGVIIRRRKVLVVFILFLGLCLLINMFQSPQRQMANALGKLQFVVDISN